MDRSLEYPSDVVFTPSVKSLQTRYGSRNAYAHLEQEGGWKTLITPDGAEIVRRQTSVFLSTANADGQPYIQHRGGPPGFLHVIDEKTIAFADFSGNRQYITTGNLADNPKAFLFLIDYARRQRIKIWGEAHVSEDAQLIAKLMPANYQARAERAIVFKVSLWDANCPRHIPQRFEAADVKAALDERDERIRELKAEVERLRNKLR
ncbi:pyridoxamine 5'-phosphate oxidase family protein [Paraburkholderia sp. DHOC27]|uniref:pyridoxamine 5'-phosphate oxidase family protein n=1 Tax=Paraburkholderia sp. DHOC27 TaxID=2303330 RepID=UPI000E3BC174|nr:pyridoxamine 5'-phosphate oxidase family protein [Paraburkholderia sp. DHOC27]RFU49861.1 pyridoxamine 5'-phosphate oxidase [Paraburkholderia sp. DHOC27]